MLGMFPFAFLENSRILPFQTQRLWCRQRFASLLSPCGLSRCFTIYYYWCFFFFRYTLAKVLMLREVSSGPNPWHDCETLTNCVSCFVLKIWLNTLCSAFKTAIHCASLRLRNNSTTNEKIRQKHWTQRERKQTIFLSFICWFLFPTQPRARLLQAPLLLWVSVWGGWGFKTQVTNLCQITKGRWTISFIWTYVHTFNKMTGKERRCGLFSQFMNNFDFTAPCIHKETWESWVEMWWKNHENVTRSCFFIATGLSNMVYGCSKMTLTSKLSHSLTKSLIIPPILQSNKGLVKPFNQFQTH